MKTILILGGYGNAGRQIARLLLERREDVLLLIGGRDPQKAEECASELNCLCGRMRAQGMRVDVADVPSLDEAVLRADFVINAAPTLQCFRNFPEALIRWQRDGMDILLSSPPKHRTLDALAPEILKQGMLYISDGGFHPGVPAVLARHAARQMDVLEQADVYSAMNVPWKSLSFSKETLEEFVEEFRDYQPLVFRQGRWQKTSSWKTFSWIFDPPFGKKTTVPMVLREMEKLPQQLPYLMQSGFFVSGFNLLTDLVLSPLMVAGLKTLPAALHPSLARMFHWGLSLSKPPYGIQLVADCRGKTDGLPMHLRISLFHEDAYLLTAAPVVACVEQYLNGELWQPGLHYQGNFVEPEPFLDAIVEMGVEKQESQGISVPAHA